MKRRYVSLGLIIVILLSGCGTKAKEQKKGGDEEMPTTEVVRIVSPDPSESNVTEVKEEKEELFTEEQKVAQGESVLLSFVDDVCLFDVNADGKKEKIELSIEKDEVRQSFILSVEGATFSQGGILMEEPCYPTGKVFACELSSFLDGTELVLELTDDTVYREYYILSFQEAENGKNQLQVIDSFYNMGFEAETNFRRNTFYIDELQNFFETLGTSQEYFIAWSAGEDEQKYKMIRIPMNLHPIGRIHTLKKDLCLLTSAVNGKKVTIKAGEDVILVAGDNMEWVYVESYKEDELGYTTSGWLQYNSCQCKNFSEWVDVFEIFEDLFNAG